MRVTGVLIGAAILAIVGSGSLAASRFDREMADAQEHLATLRYDRAAASLGRAERYAQYASSVPWIGSGPANDVLARKAALQYWQRDFGTMVPEQADPLVAIPADNLDLQLVVANAVYRVGQARAKDRRTVILALESGIEAYLTVLKNASRHEQAAFNYEFLVRLKDDIEKGRRKPDLSVEKADTPLGQPGDTARARDMGEFKVLVPLESRERDKGTEAGKAAPLKRKG